MKEFIKELKLRWKSESPIFWNKILKISTQVGVSAVAVIGADKMFDLQTYGVPQLIFTIAGYVIVACATLGLSAKITKKDSNDTN
jgi:hypothetical protein